MRFKLLSWHKIFGYHLETYDLRKFDSYIPDSFVSKGNKILWLVAQMPVNLYAREQEGDSADRRNNKSNQAGKTVRKFQH